MVCDHGLRPPRFSWQIWVIPVLGFAITTSSAQPVETPTTNIRATYRSIGVHRTRFRSEGGAAPSEKYEFGFIDGPLTGRTNGSLPVATPSVRSSFRGSPRSRLHLFWRKGSVSLSLPSSCDAV